MEAIASNTYLTRLSPPFKNLIREKEGLLKRNPSSASAQFEFTLTLHWWSLLKLEVAFCSQDF
jgi:hypothetical protein